NGIEIPVSHLKNNIEYVALDLPEAVPSGVSTQVRINFSSRIPYIFSRGDWAPHFFALTQWFPKAAVYDEEGWHLFPYLEMDEYFSDFGNYEVTIDVPRSYKIGATRVLTQTIDTD